MTVILHAPLRSGDGKRRNRMGRISRRSVLLMTATILGACTGQGADEPPGASVSASQTSLGTVPASEPSDLGRTVTTVSASQTSLGTVPASEPSDLGRTVTPIATIDVGHSSNAMTVSPDAVWIGNPSGLNQIDPDTLRLSAEIPVQNEAGFMSFGSDSLWVSDYEASILRRVDPVSGVILAEIPTGANPEGIAVTADAIWVANHRDGTVTRVDPATNAVVATIIVGSPGQGGPQWLVAGGDSVWAGVPNARAVVRIDAMTNAILAETPVTSAPGGPLAVIDDRLWAITDGNLVVVIDLETNEQIGKVPLGGVGGGIFGLGDRAWIVVSSDSGESRVVGIDAESLTLTDAIVLNEPAWGAAVAFGEVWLNHESAGTVSVLPLDSFE